MSLCLVLLSSSYVGKSHSLVTKYDHKMFLPMLTGVVSLRKECSVVRLCKDFVERSQSLVSKYAHRCMNIDVRTYVDWCVYWCGKLVSCQIFYLSDLESARSGSDS